MAKLEISSDDFALHSGYRLLQDRGTVGVLDADDLVATPEGREVAWDDDAFVTARRAYVREKIVQPAQRLAAALAPTLRLGCAADPVYRTERKPQAEQRAAAVRRVAESDDLPNALRAEALHAMASLQSYVASTDWDAKLILKAVESIHRSVALDPSSASAWTDYGATGLLVARRGVFARWYVRSNTGIDADEVIKRSIDKLKDFPQDPRAQVILQQLIEQTGRHEDLLRTVCARLETMRQDPAKAAIIAAARAEMVARQQDV
ncbi:MAG: hypothetical protein AAB426_02440, partial [Myxococcota bacterium]